MDIIQYPYDPTGTAETNRVKTVRTLPRVRNRAFAPDGGPFYKDSVVLIDVESGDEIPKSEYDCLYLYSEATERVGQSVCGIINVHNQAYYGAVEAITQVVGGSFSSNVSAIQRMLETLEIDNRKIRFDDLIDVPVTMPPAPHLTWVGDLYGAEALVTALEQITAANVNANADMADLINERYTQVYDLVNSFSGGIGDNENDINDLRDLVNNNHDSVTQSIADLAAAAADDRQDLIDTYEELDTRIKAITTQITSMVAQINANASNISSLTTSLNALTSRVTALESSLSTLSNQLSTHVNRIDNPHSVTKTQVGLGSVQNYPAGTLAEMRSGTGSRYAMSHIVKQFVEEKVAVNTASLNAHIADKSNPHETTKSHVGLSNVSNFVTGTIAEMRSGTTSRYALSHVVKGFVEEKIAAIPTGPEYVVIERSSSYTNVECHQYIVGNDPYTTVTLPLLKDGISIIENSDHYRTGIQEKGQYGYQNTVNAPSATGTTGWQLRSVGEYKLKLYRSRTWWLSGGATGGEYKAFFEIDIISIFADKNAHIYGTHMAARAKFVEMCQLGTVRLRVEDSPGGGINMGSGTTLCPVLVRTEALQLPHTLSGIGNTRMPSPPVSSPAPYYTALPSNSDVIWESNPTEGDAFSDGYEQRLIHQLLVNRVYLAVSYSPPSGPSVRLLDFILSIESLRTKKLEAP